MAITAPYKLCIDCIFKRLPKQISAWEMQYVHPLRIANCRATWPGPPASNDSFGGARLGTVLTFVGLPGLMPLPWWQTLAIFGYALIACLAVNDAVKVAMIKWRVPAAVA